MEEFVLVAVAFALIFGLFTGFVGSEKNRDKTGWFILGAIFDPIALLAVAGLPVAKDYD